MTLGWKPSLTIRPNLIGDAGGVQISDALGQQRYRMSVHDTVEAISQKSGKQIAALSEIGVVTDSAEVSEHLPGLEHWQKHNWTLALSYYLWSKRDRFLDEGEDYEALRCEALKQMLSESDLPLPALVHESEAISLGNAEPIPSDISLGDVLRKRVTTLALSSQDGMSKSVFHGLLLHGFSVSKQYHVPDVDDHIHNILHGVGFAFDPFLAVFAVHDVEPGIYYYSISQDRLKLVKRGDFRKEVCAGLIGHQQALTAACTIFLVADFPRFQWRYRHERALRNLYFDVGRMAQYLILIATAYGVKNHLTPATVDDLLAELLEVDPKTRQVFHSITLGY